MRTYRATINDGTEVRSIEDHEQPSQWSVYERSEDGLDYVIADCTTEERARALVAHKPDIFCPHCGYTGGDDYELSHGFRLREVIESFYHFELVGTELHVDPYSLDSDPEQEPSERTFHCSSCNEPFALRADFTVLFSD